MGSRSAPRVTNNSKIAQIRFSKGLTQAQLAEKMGVVTNTVNRWELGVVKPTYPLLKRLAAALEVDIRELVDGIYNDTDGV